MEGPRLLCVKASAGTGKTFELTRRFLELLLHSQVPPQREYLRQIVALTFTNKAAGEMKERIIRSLKEKALGQEEGVSQKASQWLELILENFDSFQVRTIDSFIFGLLKALVFELGQRPDLEVILDRDAVVEKAFDRLLGQVDWERDNDPLRGLFQEVTKCYLELEKGGSLKVERRIREKVKELFKVSGPSVQGEEMDLKALKRKAREVLNELIASLRIRGVTFLNKEEERKALRDPFSWFESKKNLPRPRSPFSPKEEELYREFLHLRDVYLKVKARFRLSPYLTLLERIKQEVNRICIEEGLFLVGDWHRLLREHLEREGVDYVLFKVGGPIRHFLLDEFQDTDREQWEVLRPLVENALSEGGSLFYVGDPKQAIYGWRGGDWKLLEEVFEEGFPSVSTDRRERKILDVNYRSCEEVVSFNNRLFGFFSGKEGIGRFLGGLFDREKAKKIPLRVLEEFKEVLLKNFSDAVQKSKGITGGKVEVKVLSGNKEELKAKVKEELLNSLVHRWAERGMGIAVLVRKNEEAEEVSAWIAEVGIPVVSENSLRLKNSSLIKGLVCLLRFIDQPWDWTSLWGAFKAGLFEGLEGFPDEGIKVFLETPKGQDPCEVLKALFPVGFKECLEPLIEGGAFTPYGLLWELIRRLKLFCRFQEEIPLLRRFLEVVFRAEVSGIKGVSSFLEFWDKEGAEERVGMPEEVRAVRVMTVHKAKGLEFPVVYVPFTNWKARKPQYVEDGQGGIYYVTEPTAEDLLVLRYKKWMEEVLEELNLFYVAATRAKEELYLYLTCPDRKDTGCLSLALKELMPYGFIQGDKGSPNGT